MLKNISFFGGHLDQMPGTYTAVLGGKTYNHLFLNLWESVWVRLLLNMINYDSSKGIVEHSRRSQIFHV